MPLRQGGLFGTTREAGSRDRLSVVVDASEARESGLPSDASFQVGRGQLQSGGYTSMLTTAADYSRTRRTTQLGGALFTSFKYYPHLDRVVPVTHSAALGLTLRLPKQSSLQANSTAAYAPAYLYQLFPRASQPAAVEPIATEPDFRIDQSDSYTYGTSLALAIGPPRAIRVTTTADYLHTDFRHETVTRPNLTTSGAAMKVSRGLSRNSGVSLDYAYRTGTYGRAGTTNEHRLTLGADYSHALSSTRRATFHVGLSPSLIDVSEPVVAGSLPADPLDGDRAVNTTGLSRLYRFEGDARIDYDVGRTWRATATYRRGVEYLAVLTEPVFSDAVRVELGGLITRRIDVSGGGGYAFAQSALNRDSRSLNTKTGQLRVRFALKRSLAVYSQYLYYFYDLRGQAHLAPNLPATFKQHEVRVGFMIFSRPIGNTTKGPGRWPERTRPTKS